MTHLNSTNQQQNLTQRQMNDTRQVVGKHQTVIKQQPVAQQQVTKHKPIAQQQITKSSAASQQVVIKEPRVIKYRQTADKCRWKDRNFMPCRTSFIKDTEYCKNHQYVANYTDEMKQQSKLCGGCKKVKYLENGCDECKNRSTKNREKMNKIADVLPKCKGYIQYMDGEDHEHGGKCQNKPYIDGYCNKHQVQSWKEQIEKDGTERVCGQWIRGCKNILDINDKFVECLECRCGKRGIDKTKRDTRANNSDFLVHIGTTTNGDKSIVAIPKKNTLTYEGKIYKNCDTIELPIYALNRQSVIICENGVYRNAQLNDFIKPLVTNNIDDNIVPYDLNNNSVVETICDMMKIKVDNNIHVKNKYMIDLTCEVKFDIENDDKVIDYIDGKFNKEINNIINNKINDKNISFKDLYNVYIEVDDETIGKKVANIKYFRCTKCKSIHPKKTYVTTKGDSTKKCQRCLEKFRTYDKTRNRKGRDYTNYEKKPERIAKKAQWRKDNYVKVVRYWLDARGRRMLREGDEYWTKNAAQSRKYRAEHPEKQIEANIKRRGNVEYKYNYYKREAENKGREYLLTKNQSIEYFMGDCYYCGSSAFDGVLSTNNGEYRVHHEYIILNGIDRKDNNKGYTVDNCVTACAMCNMLKGDILLDDGFIDCCEHILTNLEIIDGELHDEHFKNYIANNYKECKRSASKRKKTFDLTENMHNNISNNDCYLCGKRNSKDHWNGIDRVNNHIGYFFENCMACCGTCNYIKNNYELIDVLYKMINIVKKHKNISDEDICFDNNMYFEIVNYSGIHCNLDFDSEEIEVDKDSKEHIECDDNDDIYANNQIKHTQLPENEIKTTYMYSDKHNAGYIKYTNGNNIIKIITCNTSEEFDQKFALYIDLLKQPLSEKGRNEIDKRCLALTTLQNQQLSKKTNENIIEN